MENSNIKRVFKHSIMENAPLRQYFKCSDCGGECTEQVGKDQYTTIVSCTCGFRRELQWSQPIEIQQPYSIIYASFA